jgi:hypothetical protein
MFVSMYEDIENTLNGFRNSINNDKINLVCINKQHSIFPFYIANSVVFFVLNSNLNFVLRLLAMESF